MLYYEWGKERLSSRPSTRKTALFAVTRKTDLALVTLAHLAREQTLCSAREMADRYRLPLPMLTNVLKSLCQAGLVYSERGARGGYRLADAPENISVLQVMEAMEGPFRLVQCTISDASDAASGASTRSEDGIHGSLTACEVENLCPIRSPVRRVYHALRDHLNNITIADISGSEPEPILVQATVVRES